MALDKTTVANIAFLARIDIPEDRQETLARELSSILTWVEQLEQVDTQGVEPMASVANLALSWRPDAVTDGGCVDDVLSNAPEKNSNCFVVPRMVE
ncbi:Asp-tRNA(Asn)/Glu-tRNA(Gln) amidotransferase subunit GatC [Phaeovibrio sulfidiphilus]|uniref:Aspartyl/glutamyl-tRNA(Asn/Gln) amidotransferase subunit C n=1 Tax=Phaeovibrio sulfidiphilus TaxID=1220600 RepID=A0A8J6YUH3_9PROT|nr:Asp-tRNA(Asn)/Glu-tRNA(Gln) amidotransferase subunit GatC [Phaeovibrio sulfidiphilus]MBE1236644.1 Asp-tRNA(Asn)/Glu-tRNA(Gln) amidotransferase subunit GatC [Phaeovibrio sulfidiphilus]